MSRTFRISVAVAGASLAGPAIGGARREGHLRHQLGRRGRARRLLPGGRRRHLREIRPEGHDRAGRPAGRPTGRCCSAARSQFYMEGNLLGRSTPSSRTSRCVEVAAIFQKDPQVLMAHPDQGLEKFDDLAKLPTSSSSATIASQTYFQWMKRPTPASTTSSASPTPSTRRRSSPTRSRPAGLPHLRAARGREGRRLQAERLPDGRRRLQHLLDHDRGQGRLRRQAKPDIVQRFVDASIIGWYNYLYGDNKAANELIKKDNPDMTDEQIAFSIAQDEGIRHGRFRRRAEKGIGCYDRRARRRTSTTRWSRPKRGQGRPRLSRRPTPTRVRLQGRRHGPEEVATRISRRGIAAAPQRRQ